MSWKALAAIYDIRPEDMRDRLLQALETIYTIADELETDATEASILGGIDSLNREVIDANNTADENAEAFEQLEEETARADTAEEEVSKLNDVLSRAMTAARDLIEVVEPSKSKRKTKP